MRHAAVYVWCWLRTRHTLASIVADLYMSALAIRVEAHRSAIDHAHTVNHLQACISALSEQRDDLLEALENGRLIEKWWSAS